MNKVTRNQAASGCLQRLAFVGGKKRTPSLSEDIEINRTVQRSTWIREKDYKPNATGYASDVQRNRR